MPQSVSKNTWGTWWYLSGDLAFVGRVFMRLGTRIYAAIELLPSLIRIHSLVHRENLNTARSSSNTFLNYLHTTPTLLLEQPRARNTRVGQLCLVQLLLTSTRFVFDFHCSYSWHHPTISLAMMTNTSIKNGQLNFYVDSNNISSSTVWSLLLLFNFYSSPCYVVDRVLTEYFWFRYIWKRSTTTM